MLLNQVHLKFWMLRIEKAMFNMAKKHEVDTTCLRLAALLSATAEKKPLLAWHLQNIGRIGRIL